MIKKSGWTYKIQLPLKTPIVVCLCGNKYLKTREGQIACVRCINKTQKTA